MKQQHDTALNENEGIKQKYHTTLCALFKTVREYWVTTDKNVKREITTLEQQVTTLSNANAGLAQEKSDISRDITTKSLWLVSAREKAKRWVDSRLNTNYNIVGLNNEIQQLQQQNAILQGELNNNNTSHQGSSEHVDPELAEQREQQEQQPDIQQPYRANKTLANVKLVFGLLGALGGTALAAYGRISTDSAPLQVGGAIMAATGVLLLGNGMQERSYS